MKNLTTVLCVVSIFGVLLPPLVLAQAKRTQPTAPAAAPLRDLGAPGLRMGEYLVTEEYVPKQGLSLGIGWNRAVAQKMSSRCVVGQELPVSGSSYDMNFYDTFDREQVTRALNVSAKASYAGMASGSSDFSRTIKIDHQKRNILAVVTVDKGDSLFQ